MASVVKRTEAIEPFWHWFSLDRGLYVDFQPIFGFGSYRTEASTLTSSHFLASSPDGPRPKHLFGTGFERTATYTPLWLRVFGEPRPKTWL